MDRDVVTVERRDVDLPEPGIPGDLAPRRRPAAHECRDGVPVGGEPLAQRGADHPAGTRHQDTHQQSPSPAIETTSLRVCRSAQRFPRIGEAFVGLPGVRTTALRTSGVDVTTDRIA